MTQKNNATCLICGKEYYVCLSCRDSMKISPWKTYTDTSEHYKVFQIVKGFHNGVYNKEEAKSKLNNVDLSDLNNYRQKIKDVIKDILEEDKPIVKVIENVEKPVDIITVEETEEVVEKPIYSRKRNYKVEVEQY